MKKYNWQEIQSDYDCGMSQSSLRKKYGMSSRTIFLAIQRGEFKSRTVSDAVKIHRARNPRSIESSIKMSDSLSKIISAKVANGTWHTSLARRMHVDYKGIDLHGSWEVAYAKYLDQNNIKWIRNKDSFDYVFENKKRKYTPDFYLTESQEYIEIKGYKTAKDCAKWEQFPKDEVLKILTEKELRELKII